MEVDKFKLITSVFQMTLQNCQDDTAYNDNTLYDCLMHGFKGFENMSIEELQQEYSYLMEGRE